MVMHMTYGIRLPDHDVNATSHKLTQSVYATCKITRCSRVTSTYQALDQSILLFEVVNMILAQLIHMVKILTNF